MRRRMGWKVFILLPMVLVTGWRGYAQGPEIAAIINAGVKRVIIATDLVIERKQTETIVAQNAAKERENEMQRSELADIADWVERQRALFASYYEELRVVKQVIARYEAVKRMIDKQAGIIAGYRQAYAVLRQDGHFTGEEMDHAYRVLSGIAGQSAANVKRLWVVVTSLVTQMDDGARLRLIDETGKDIDGNYADLAEFSQQHFLLSMQRAKDARDMAVIKALYGIQ